MIAENIERNSEIDVQDVLHRFIASEMNKAKNAPIDPKIGNQTFRTNLDDGA